MFEHHADFFADAFAANGGDAVLHVVDGGAGLGFD